MSVKAFSSVIVFEAHKDQRYKAYGFCLHYHVWNSTTSVNTKSWFIPLWEVGVKTLTDAGVSEKHTHLLLNLAEMWMCIAFQILPQQSLEEYTPPGSRIVWAGQHLNVALPLWQSFRDDEDAEFWEERALGAVTKESFRNLLFSADPKIRAWAESMRDSFHALRDSHDPKHREYHEKVMQRFRNAGLAMLHKNAMASYQRVLLEGKDCKVSFHERHVVVVCQTFSFTVSQKLGLRLQDGDSVRLKFELITIMRLMPRQQTQRFDLESVSLGKITLDISRHGYLLAVKHGYGDMNYLVDMLEGVDYEDSLNTPGRRMRLERDGRRVLKAGK